MDVVYGLKRRRAKQEQCIKTGGKKKMPEIFTTPHVSTLRSPCNRAQACGNYREYT